MWIEIPTETSTVTIIKSKSKLTVETSTTVPPDVSK
jgi:hypothetical protein